MHIVPALIVNIGAGIGYPLLFAVVASEAGGLPVPGETALVAAAIAASHHRLHITSVIAVAAVAAIIGDNAGYFIGRKVGRKLLEARGPFARHRRKVLELGKPFFARHGNKAVFFGRWVTGLRTWASWLAGTSHMPWRSFAAWNAFGGVAWATTMGLLAYALGHAVKGAVGLFGAFAAVSTITALTAVWVRRRSGWRPAPVSHSGSAADGEPADVCAAGDSRREPDRATNGARPGRASIDLKSTTPGERPRPAREPPHTAG
jgi:membrane protein DedA with SNARE-associated domain